MQRKEIPWIPRYSSTKQRILKIREVLFNTYLCEYRRETHLILTKHSLRDVRALPRVVALATSNDPPVDKDDDKLPPLIE